MYIFKINIHKSSSATLGRISHLGGAVFPHLEVHDFTYVRITLHIRTCKSLLSFVFDGKGVLLGGAVADYDRLPCSYEYRLGYLKKMLSRANTPIATG